MKKPILTPPERANYTTTLKPEMIQQLKLQAVYENRGANLIVEQAISRYLKNKNMEVTKND